MIPNEIIWSVVSGLGGVAVGIVGSYFGILRGVENKLSENSGKLDLLIGIRNDLTEHQALCAARNEKRKEQILYTDSKAEKAHTRIDILKSQIERIN